MRIGSLVKASVPVVVGVILAGYLLSLVPSGTPVLHDARRGLGG